MKAILVLDAMPYGCVDCRLADQKYIPDSPSEGMPHHIYCTGREKTIANSWLDLADSDRRPDWCPLKEVPDKLSMNDYDEHTTKDFEKLLQYYNDGFNDCIDQIVKEED